MKNIINLNFWGLGVRVETEWVEIGELIQKDFAHFIVSGNIEIFLNLSIYNQPADFVQAPKGLKPKLKTKNSITFQDKKVRYNDYYGKVLTVFDYAIETCFIYGQDEDRVHEISYLLILSRIGKKLDRMGLHKLHAFAVSYREIAFVCMMPSGGGKSTLLVELLKNPEVKIISDDIPLITSQGTVIPFPLKIGLDKGCKFDLEVKDAGTNIYSMKRELHGEKQLICLNGIADKVENFNHEFSNIILAEGFRRESGEVKIKKSSWISSFRALFLHGIIGFGLPLIFEYFWEFGIKDFLVKTNIFLRRMYAFINLNSRSKRVKFYFSNNSLDAAKAIINYMNQFAQ